jgi:hypothetical protein
MRLWRMGVLTGMATICIRCQYGAYFGREDFSRGARSLPKRSFGIVCINEGPQLLGTYKLLPSFCFLILQTVLVVTANMIWPYSFINCCTAETTLGMPSEEPLLMQEAWTDWPVDCVSLLHCGTDSHPLNPVRLIAVRYSFTQHSQTT